MDLVAQKGFDNLEPVAGFFGIYDFEFEYYSKVKKVLFTGLSDSPEIRFQVFPSFSSEYVLDIEFNQEDNTYYLVYHIAETSIWDTDNWGTIEVNSTKKPISKEAAELVKRLFEKAILKTHYPERPRMGNDGTTYYFSVKEYGQRTGKVWSPSKGTKMSKLVAVGQILKKLSMDSKEQVEFDNLTVEFIEGLIIELE